MQQLTNLVVTYDQFLSAKENLINRGVLVTGMPNDAYHKHEGISNSGLKLVKRSPAHYKYPEPFNHTRAKQMGTAIHAAVLETEYFKDHFMLLDEVENRQKPEYKKACKALDDPKGDFVFVNDECRRIRGMYQAIKKHPRVFELMQEDGWSELSGFIRDSNGIIRKIRFDRLSVSCKAIDLKKCQDSRAEVFVKDVTSYGYYFQAAWYTDTFKMLTGGLELDKFRLVAFEEKSPHAVEVHPVSEAAMIIGRDEYEEAYNKYVECVKTDTWPTYEHEEGEEEQEIGVTNWKVYEWEEKHADDKLEITYD